MRTAAGANGASEHADSRHEADRLREIAEARFDLSISTASGFFDENAGAISKASFHMAKRFQRGGRLLVFGEGAGATDAQHVSVEFVHPVIVGKRALPAIALTNDVATLTAIGNTSAPADAFTAMVTTLGRAGDIALEVRTGMAARRNSSALREASRLGMLTISIEAASRPGAAFDTADHIFRLPADDALVAQEVAETLYHILWELVHLFLEHGCGDGRETAACTPAEDGTCSICADEALRGVVLSLNAADGTAQVQLPVEVATVAVDLLDEARVGDAVMVHMGFAIARVGSAT